LKTTAHGASDPGRRRELNEDSYGVFPEYGLYMVADGMGGHAAGEVASRMALDGVEDFIEATSGFDGMSWEDAGESGEARPPCERRLAAAFRVANRSIFAVSAERQDRRGMGTTALAALFGEENVTIANVGDSRAYLFRDGTLRQITTDHSYVREMVDAGLVSAAAARKHPLRNVITRALGSKPEVLADTVTHKLVSGDVYLMCTDGLYGMVEDEALVDVVARHIDSPTGCVEELIRLANENGGEDNITAIVVRVH